MIVTWSTHLASIMNQSELLSGECLIAEMVPGLSADIVFMCHPSLVQSVQKCAIISLQRI